MIAGREERLLHALPLAAALLDASGIVIAANQLAEHELGDGLVGAPFFPKVADDALAGPAEESFRNGMARGDVSDTLHLPIRRILMRSLPGTEKLAVVVILGSSTTGKPGQVPARALEIASKVKHDVNNLLMGLLGQTSLLQTRPEISDGSRAKIAQIEEQGRKIRDTVARLDAIRTLVDD